MDEAEAYQCPECFHPMRIPGPVEGDFLVCLKCCEVCRVAVVANTRSRLGKIGEIAFELAPTTDQEVVEWWRGVQALQRSKL